jgi:hypothetical protein
MAIQYEMDNSEVDFKYCPAGRTACSISYDRADGYECIDTDTELESCGGCRFGNYAYDTDVVGEE